MAASIGNVTSDSISSGAMPWPSVRIVTVGAVRSGNTSTGMSRATQQPARGQQDRQRDAPSSDGRSTIESGVHVFTQCTCPSAGRPLAADASCTSYASANHHALAWLDARS